MLIIQLVPTSPANKTGISAYSSLLAEEMTLRKEITSQFLCSRDIQSRGTEYLLLSMSENIEGIIVHCDFRHYTDFFGFLRI
jgi:uncharacterized protein YllA (UPF0747 family)